MAYPRIAQHNLLLNALSPSALEHLQPHLERVTLALKDPIETLGRPVSHAYFFETAMTSNVAELNIERAEVGLCGREGMSGLAILHGVDQAPFHSYVQMAGEALRIEAGALREAMRTNNELHDILLQYSHLHAVQVAYTALANVRFPILPRAARWLLMCHDRAAGENFELTHEFMALMLGVRRAGITTEMHVLEGEHAIVNRRGLIVVRDRIKLEEFAEESYGLPEAEYERVLGQRLRRNAPRAESDKALA